MVKRTSQDSMSELIDLELKGVTEAHVKDQKEEKIMFCGLKIQTTSFSHNV